ncbi:MAG: TIR domain-containing protein [Lachnospiraceae bacterium]|nr:TIR domain-containing protein [Lachnospiraceae bacterium]
MANLKDIKYDAFISYRHSEFDSFVVENLHKKLENFKLPKSVLKKVKNGRTRINRVFRDVDELPLADNLSEPINEALRNSDYLITVCTPRYPQSRWCMKEIETFLQTHNRDHILVVLAEDEPVNSFPEILTLEEVETVDEKGEKVIIRRELEPLAADTRGENKKEVLKAMDTAVIKLAAAMFGLEFDDLRQRRREQKMRRMAAVFGSIGAAVLGFAIFATSALIKISRQNDMINEQYAELQDSFAGTMANVSRQLLQEGRRKDAVYAVRNVLPGSKEDGFNNSAFNALVTAMDIYKVSSQHSPVCVYDTDGWLNDYKISFDGNYILTSDDDSVFVYNVSDADLIKKIEKRKTGGTFGMFEAAFCGEQGILVCDNGEATYYSLEDQTSKNVDIDSESFLFSSDDGFVTYACFSDILYAVDNYGDVMYTLDIEKALRCNDIWVNDISFNNGDVLMSFDTGDSCRVCLIDEYSGEVKYTDRFDEKYEMSCAADGGIIYAALTGTSESSAFSTDIYAIDTKTGRKLWKQTAEDYKIESGGTAVTDRLFMVCGMNDILVFDRESGELLKEHTFSDMICSCWVDDNWFHFILEDGTVLYCDDESVTKISDFYTIAPSGDISNAYFKNGNLFCKFWLSNYVIRYSDMISPLAKEDSDTESYQEYSEIEDTDIFDDEEYNVNGEMVSFALYSVDKKYLLVQFIDKVIKIIDTETKVCVNTLVGPAEDDLFDFRYNDLTECYIISGTRSYLLDDKFNIVCETGLITGRDGNDLILMDDDFVPQRIPWLSYEGMLQKADEYLGDYVPSEEIRERYGIALPAEK